MDCPTCGKETKIKTCQSIAFKGSKPFYRSACECGWFGVDMTRRQANELESDEMSMYGAAGDWMRKPKPKSLLDAFVAGWEAKRSFDKIKKEARKRR